MITTLILGFTAAMAPGSEGKPALTPLDKSVEPLRSRFNADKDKLRFVAILSPT